MTENEKFLTKEGLISNKNFLVVQIGDIITIDRVISLTSFNSKYFECTLIDNTMHEPIIFLCDQVAYNNKSKQIHILNTTRSGDPNVGVFSLKYYESASVYSNGDKGILIVLNNMEEN